MYSFYFGILPSLGIESISAWMFLSAFLAIITGFITSMAEIIALKKDNMMFSSILAFSSMMVYLLLFGIVGVISLPSIWLVTHVLIIQTKQG